MSGYITYLSGDQFEGAAFGIQISGRDHESAFEKRPDQYRDISTRVHENQKCNNVIYLGIQLYISSKKENIQWQCIQANK